MPDKTNTYSNSLIINYPEGDQSLERAIVVYKEDINDKLHIVREEEFITAIAEKYYRQPWLWFIIADANDIINPFVLEVGQELVIPNIENYEI